MLVEHLHAALRDRAKGQLFVSGHTELAHEKDIERHTQGSRDLGRDGHAAARQPEHGDVGAIRVAREQPGQLASRMDAVFEAHVAARPGRQPL